MAVVTNVGCWSKPLNLSSPVLAKMYDGAITTWDSPLLNADNPGLSSACARVPVNLVARSDSSGTTYIFKDYLSKRNPEYAALSQSQLNTTWPGSIACRGAGNSGVLGCVTGTADSIGYVGYANAAPTGVSMARVDNPAHQFSAP